MVQACGRSVRSKEDWAKTYVLDSGFRSFVRENTDTLPNWFTQAIRGTVYTGTSTTQYTRKRLQLGINNINCEKDAAVSLSDYSEREIANTKPHKSISSYNLLNLLGLEEHNISKDESTHFVYSCYHCKDFQTVSKRDYECHGVQKHTGKPLYPSKADLKRHGIKGKDMPWEI